MVVVVVVLVCVGLEFWVQKKGRGCAFFCMSFCPSRVIGILFSFFYVPDKKTKMGK